MVVDNTALFRAQTIILNKKDESVGNEGMENKAISSEGKKTSNATAPSNFSFYCVHARQILTDITELRDLVLDKRKEYILCSNAFSLSLYGVQKFMSDEDRRKFDQETDLAFKYCTKLIKGLEAQIESDRTLRPLDQLKHLLAVTNLLSIYLKEVLSIVTQLRAIRVRKSRQISRFCRLANLVEMYGSRIEQAQREEEMKALKLVHMLEELKKSETSKEEKEEANGGNKENILDGWEEANIEEDGLLLIKEEGGGEATKVKEQRQNSVDGWEETHIEEEEMFTDAKEQHQPVKGWKGVDGWEDGGGVEESEQQPKAVEQPLLLEENRKLFERLTATDTELTTIETQMSEIQRMQGIFAEMISEQEQKIDIIHSRTVYTLDNLETANEFIREAIKNQANRRVIIIFCLLVLTFTLLFLDWYNP